MIRDQQKTPQFYRPNDLKIGLTLQQYLIKNQHHQELEESFQDQEEDLYTCAKIHQLIANKKPNKLDTFAIDEIDEDNYHDQPPVHQYHQNIPNHQTFYSPKDFTQNTNLVLNLRDKPKIFSIDQKNTRTQLNQKIKHHSINSKNLAIKKKEMFRSLYGNQFGGLLPRPSDPSIFSSTLRNKFLKINEVTKALKKQVEFKQKHKKQYNEMMKYQNVMQSKHYNKLDILKIRVDGIKDKLYTRKNYHRN